MKQEVLNKLIASAELRNPGIFNASRERYIAEISFKEAIKLRDKEWVEIMDITSQIAQGRGNYIVVQALMDIKSKMGVEDD